MAALGNIAGYVIGDLVSAVVARRIGGGISLADPLVERVKNVIFSALSGESDARILATASSLSDTYFNNLVSGIRERLAAKEGLPRGALDENLRAIKDEMRAALVNPENEAEVIEAAKVAYKQYTFEPLAEAVAHRIGGGIQTSDPLVQTVTNEVEHVLTILPPASRTSAVIDTLPASYFDNLVSSARQFHSLPAGAARDAMQRNMVMLREEAFNFLDKMTDSSRLAANVGSTASGLQGVVSKTATAAEAVGEEAKGLLEKWRKWGGKLFGWGSKVIPAIELISAADAVMEGHGAEAAIRGLEATGPEGQIAGQVARGLATKAGIQDVDPPSIITPIRLTSEDKAFFDFVDKIPGKVVPGMSDSLKKLVSSNAERLDAQATFGKAVGPTEIIPARTRLEKAESTLQAAIDKTDTLPGGRGVILAEIQKLNTADKKIATLVNGVGTLPACISKGEECKTDPAKLVSSPTPTDPTQHRVGTHI